jgi:MFS transporter, FHS family, L-fucose permease
MIRFAEFAVPGTREKLAAHYLQLHVFSFMLGRLVGSGIMKHIAPPKLLSLFAGSALVCLTIALSASGRAPVWALVFLGFFHSIMFPTIFALSLKELGPYTKLGSSLLVMSIIGGAVCPAMMGLVSDTWNIQTAFALPLFCHAFIFYFAIRGYRPASQPQPNAVLTAATD